MLARAWFGLLVLAACSHAPTRTDTTDDDPVEPSPVLSPSDGPPAPEGLASTETPADDDEFVVQPSPADSSVPGRRPEGKADSGAGGWGAGAAGSPARDSGPPGGGPSEAGHDGQEPSNEASTACQETLQEFQDALTAAARLSESYDCTSNEDCVEVDRCGGKVFCEIGEFLNRSAAEQFEANLDARCACGGDSECVEPEPPHAACLEGVCWGHHGNREEVVAPVTCEERERSWERFTSVLVDSNLAYGGCAVIGVGNGCTGGECRYFAVSLRELDKLRARLESHLGFNDCESCGPTLPCDAPPAVTDVNGRCQLAP